MSEIIKFPKREKPEDEMFNGPYDDPPYRLTSGGYDVPLLAAGIDGERVNLFLDRRFGIETTKEECARWIPFLANAMAIAAGYSCHGENSQSINPYKCRVMQIGAVETEPAP
jgi:hypothetical protein